MLPECGQVCLQSPSLHKVRAVYFLYLPGKWFASNWSSKENRLLILLLTESAFCLVCIWRDLASQRSVKSDRKSPAIFQYCRYWMVYTIGLLILQLYFLDLCVELTAATHWAVYFPGGLLHCSIAQCTFPAAGGFVSSYLARSLP